MAEPTDAIRARRGLRRPAESRSLNDHWLSGAFVIFVYFVDQKIGAGAAQWLMRGFSLYCPSRKDSKISEAWG